jgi:hypothetical protein
MFNIYMLQPQPFGLKASIVFPFQPSNLIFSVNGFDLRVSMIFDASYGGFSNSTLSNCHFTISLSFVLQPNFEFYSELIFSKLSWVYECDGEFQRLAATLFCSAREAIPLPGSPRSLARTRRNHLPIVHEYEFLGCILIVPACHSHGDPSLHCEIHDLEEDLKCMISSRHWSPHRYPTLINDSVSMTFRCHFIPKPVRTLSLNTRRAPYLSQN